MEETKEKNLVEKTKETLINAIDENGNGEIDVEDILIKSLRIPGIKINRANFLQKELLKRCSQETINKAIATTPSHAGISVETLDKIADDVINYERICVSGISTALGVPGGVAMVATIPADLAQYYAYTLRAVQKLLYLYGFPEIDFEEKEQHFDSETINLIIVCLGAMYGVTGARNLLLKISEQLAIGVSKKLQYATLKKIAGYALFKQILKWFNVQLNRKLLQTIARATIPVVGGLIGGTITFLSFKPCCDALKESLRDTYLTNPNRKNNEELEEIVVEEEE